MRKSKLILKNSKDIISRSFDPVKCKTSLRLAGSRLKLLRNRKEVQLNHMKKEIARLLQSGQEESARIKVEHVIREEKMVTAFELIEIYCELIVARMSMVESQKTCPDDLQEAITSVLFASPRCGDVPDLLDVKKHFTAKYGKGFTTAAIELHPDCGVSRMMVEKLSAMAPDGKTKIKTLRAIAAEYDVDWKPESFGQKDSAPPSELLSGPSTFGKVSEPHVEPPRWEAPQSNNMMHAPPPRFEAPSVLPPPPPPFEVPDFQAPQSNNTSQLVDYKTSMGTEKLTSAQTSGVSTTFQHNARPLGDEREQLKMWNMEFKDAAEAGKAAAEFADRAIMAFKAAAELSGDNSDDEAPGTNMNWKLPNAQFSEHTRLLEEKINAKRPNDVKTERSEDGCGGSTEYSQSSTLKSKASIVDDSLDHVVPAESDDGLPENSHNFRKEKIRAQPGVNHSRSRSSISDDVNIFADSEDPSLGFQKEGIYGEAFQGRSSEPAPAVFDEYDSDSDIYGFSKGPTYNGKEPGFRFPSSGRKSLDQHSIDPDSWSPRSTSSKIENPTSSLFSSRKNSPEKLTKLDDPVPVTFDESDGSPFENDMNRHGWMDDSRDRTHEHNQSVRSNFKDKETGYSRFEGKQLSLSSSPENEEGLNFGKLTGGLRHKGYNHPAYMEDQFDVSSSSKDKFERSTASSGVDDPRISTMSEHKKTTRTPYLYSESYCDSSEEEQESLPKGSRH